MSIWKILGGHPIRGTDHEKLGTNCQDACIVHEFNLNGEHVLISSVSDGAGTAKMSEIGSSIVAEEIAFFLENFVRINPSENITEKLLLEEFEACIHNIKQKISELAKIQSLSARDYASTCVAAVALPTVFICVQIGDGCIVYETEGEIQIAFFPDNGEYLNETTFITNAKQNEIHIKIINKSITSFCVMSDGLEIFALNFKTRTPHEGFFYPLFKQTRETQDLKSLNNYFKSFLSSEKINSRTGDDKTIVIACKTIDDNLSDLC